MSYISDFLKELEKLNQTTLSKVQNTQKKIQMAAGMQSKDKYTSDFFKELYKLEEEEALKKNQEKKKTRFDEPIKTSSNEIEEFTTAAKKRKESQSKSTVSGTVGGGGRSFDKSEERKTTSDKSHSGSGGSFGEQKDSIRKKDSDMYVDIGNGFKINRRTKTVVTSDNVVVGKYDEKTGVVSSKDGTRYFSIRDDGSFHLYEAAKELGFDTSKAKDSWFQAGTLADGYQFGDITKGIAATSSEIGKGVLSGALNFGENTVDVVATAGGYIGKGVGKLAGAEDYKIQDWEEMIGEFIAKDIINEDAIADTIFGQPSFLDEDTEEASFLGKKSTGVAESGGQLLLQAGLQALGVPWQVTSSIFSFGSEMENALQQGATFDQAATSGAISTASELITEKLFGVFGFQGKGLDEGMKTAISRGIENKTLRTLAKFGLDFGGEGIEEVLSGIGSALGQKATYASDKEFRELFSSEDAWDSFIGGAVLGGGGNLVNGVKAKIKGVDAVTGLKPNEQKLVDRIYKDEVAKAEKDGKKLKSGEKNQLYDDIRQALAEGDIDVDVIEEELGGDSYNDFKASVDAFNNSDDFKAYKAALAEEEALKKEYDELSKVKSTEADLGQQARFTELQNKLEELKTKSKSKELRAKLQSDIDRINGLKQKMRGEVMEKVKGDKLAESYREMIRSQQKFTADPSQYKSEAAKKTVENFTKNANATNKHRRLFDMAIKIAEDKGIEFDLTDNDKLKGTMHDKGEGVSTNGFITKDGKGGVKVTVNMSSPKALEFIVGHEVTHPFEGTKLYKTLQKFAFKAAEANADLQKRIQDTRDLYKEHDPDADVDSEITGDIIGELVFTDRDFVMNLSTEHRNIFEKMYDEVKYLAKIATAGSTEARRIEKLKKVFAEAYRSTNVTKNTDAKTQNSLSKTEYMDAVNRKDMVTAQKMADEAAKEAGFPVKVYHGTKQFGFTKPNVKKSDDGISFFATEDIGVAGSYSGITVAEERKISDSNQKLARKDVPKLSNQVKDIANEFVNGYTNALGHQSWYMVAVDSITDQDLYDIKSPKDLMDYATTAIDTISSVHLNTMDGEPGKHKGTITEETKQQLTKLTEEYTQKLSSLIAPYSESGVYGLYANTDNFLVIDAQGSYWNKIKSDALPARDEAWTTRDVAKYAKDQGYSGVKFENIIDPANGTAHTPATVYAFFNPGSQLKSADPVTYDNLGRPIPLDKRFDTKKGDFRYSLTMVDPVQPKSNAWQRSHTTEEVKAQFPGLWDIVADDSDTRNPTQIVGTVKSYRKIYDALQAEGFDGKILDASSGLGIGTKAGIEEYGFDVDDIEPYPDKDYNPKYKDYSTLNEKYDVIISNAVLNVLPQEQRDALVSKMGELLNDGGRIFVNVRGKDVESASSKVAIDESQMEYYISNKGTYQKGFTKAELKAYLEDALGDGFKVETTNKFGAVSAIVTKESGVKYSLSSIANSFFGDENMSADEFLKANYTETQGYKNYVDQCLNNYKQSRQNFNADEAKKSIEKSIAGIIRVAVAAKKAGYDIYDDATKRSKRDSKKRLLFSSLEPNSEYTTSNDISTICDKRKNFAEIYDDIVKAEEAKGVPVGKRFFDNVDNYFYLHKLMADKGLTQPCRQCYVESMRKNLAPMASAFLRLVRETNPNNTANDQLYHQKGKTKGGLKVNNYATRSWVLEKLAEYEMTASDLNIETLTTADGLARLKIQAPLIYEAFNSFYGQILF